ncbi:S-layer homology domain-containing protein [Petrocella sp. FN5]|uniref:S-layer homology domain-containing protein n=1 Tax=Petrocella sp. FN5 TaxID=3032002 RepID=UPI0023DBE1F3|nr:S-layer homology domain-containing protein [Petrocella sp. FN5]MDF1618743.1 S-layer homology domain-containing protein [Petrocella sp. FN5]
MKKRIISALFVMTMMVTMVMEGLPVHAQGQASNIISATEGNTTFYITKDNGLWGYGDNYFGQIGNGFKQDFVAVPYKIMDNVKSVATNQGNTFAVKHDDSLWCWGSNTNSVFGNDATREILRPIKIMDDVNMVSAHRGYAMVIKTDGSLWIAGANMPNLSNDILNEEANKRVYTQIMKDETFKYISATQYGAFLINENNELWGFGRNNNSVLGLGHDEEVTIPTKIMNDVEYVAGGGSNVVVVKKDGSLWVVGQDTDGEVTKKMDNVLYGFTTSNGKSFFAVKRDNTLWGWGGERYFDQMMSDYKSEPRLIMSGVYFASAGTRHLIAAKTDGTLWNGGENYNGGILGKETKKTSPRYPMEKAVDNIKDAPAPWALAEVREAEFRKLVPPEMQSEYSKTVTRTEFCTLAVIMIEQANEMTVEKYIQSKGLSLPAVSPFEDINGLSERAKNDILAAYTLDIVNGTSATTFDPNNPITREQAAKMLTATATALDENTSAEVPSFADAEAIANWAKPYIGYVFNAKVMTGVGNERFDPRGGYQRQQAYMTLLRLYKEIKGI